MLLKKHAQSDLSADLEAIPEFENDLTEAEDLMSKKLNFIDGIFLDGHRTYDTKPVKYDPKLVGTKQYHCPVCKQTFKGWLPFTSKLVTERVDLDLRTHYRDFPHILFEYITCPSCYYSAYFRTFDKRNYSSVMKLKQLYNIHDKIAYHPSDEPNVNNSFLSYYLARYCELIAKENQFYQIARISLRIHWLYNDEGDKEMSDKALILSAQDYYNAYYNTTKALGVRALQETCVLMGELYMKSKMYKEAYKIFQKALIKDVNASKVYVAHARDRIQDAIEQLNTAGA